MSVMYATEHKSKSIQDLRRIYVPMVRVFIDHDYGYGYFIDEEKLLCDILNNFQVEEYFLSDKEIQISATQVAKIKKLGWTYRG